jgi:hypothetical protein
MGELERAEGRRGRGSIADLVLGGIGGAMVILALLSAVFGRESTAAPADAPPSVVILSPADEGVVTGRLEIQFRPAAAINPSPAGWGTDRFHLHLDLNGRELMPGLDQVQRLPSGDYRWAVGAVPPGVHTLRLFWSDAAHRPVQGGGSESVTIEIR